MATIRKRALYKRQVRMLAKLSDPRFWRVAQSDALGLGNCLFHLKDDNGRPFFLYESPAWENLEYLRRHHLIFGENAAEVLRGIGYMCRLVLQKTGWQQNGQVAREVEWLIGRRAVPGGDVDKTFANQKGNLGFARAAHLLETILLRFGPFERRTPQAA